MPSSYFVLCQLVVGLAGVLGQCALLVVAVVSNGALDRARATLPESVTETLGRNESAPQLTVLRPSRVGLDILRAEKEREALPCSIFCCCGSNRRQIHLLHWSFSLHIFFLKLVQDSQKKNQGQYFDERFALGLLQRPTSRAKRLSK